MKSKESRKSIGLLVQKFVCSILLIFLVGCGTSGSLHHKPITKGYDSIAPRVEKISPEKFISGNNFLIKNKQQLWELYVEGDPLQIGLTTGALEDSLLKKQEKVFFSKIEEIVPSKSKQKLLRKILTWYNRKLYLNVPEEYKTEIYGLSQYTSHDYDFIAPRYLRTLYLHGAHDIGHAMQDLMLVGCSSFAAWGDKSADGKLILGRNFDFYAGDDFAKDKVIAFIRPDKGNAFMTVTWAGMIGAVSGMNDKGLTVTINAGKSKIPLIAKTPISILTREILQYASTIDEAVAIAKKRQVFVSEAIMVGSAKDGKAALIEVSPKNFGVYEVPNSADQLLCSNHFQSEPYKNDKRNNDAIKNSHSKYRFDKLTEDFNRNPKINPEIAASILRDTKSLEGGLPLGYGNEKALNQLLAHHGVIFQPNDLKVWVSANPYQLGEFVCYDLHAIFGKERNSKFVSTLAANSLNIAQDPFANSEAFKKYEQYRIEDRKMDGFLENESGMTEEFARNYQSLNPDLWIVHYKVGQYYFGKKEYAKAKPHFEMALTKEITTLPAKEHAQEYLKKINKKLKK
ncbi:acyl-CoA--6-aminopenicillanic acid acyl-transferase [Flavobacterium sp. MAH-1]|uniref:Acyl-CoA--6-aminopenicillanic acid acyl-transferase n=1 Tax=Flavobacterium agri TaxID=2743471 RepID=A0A7Y8Y300_9FLAO|nr:C45 family peptidase [Flavobacterium agri]NUY81401.1 acyl-CoA--6-aminopenicillanic acid acyl-transferase [Flavobacterium agri]NYA71425.1 acyl-CoA--6-aminopenicillanic acid acyl-transferase [Flavobacterium agri]